MSETQPDLITVTATTEASLNANSAELIVFVRGSQFYAGDAAIKKAREVSQMIDALLTNGVKPDAIELISVSATSSGGGISRTSSASYTLRITCRDLDQLGDLIGIITARKDVTLQAITWKYPDDTTFYDEQLDRTIARAQHKAARIAAALGVRLLGVHTFNQSVGTNEPRPMFRAMAMPMDAAPAPVRTPSADIGVDITHSKMISTSVTIEYRVSALADA